MSPSACISAIKSPAALLVTSASLSHHLNLAIFHPHSSFHYFHLCLSCYRPQNSFSRAQTLDGGTIDGLIDFAQEIARTVRISEAIAQQSRGGACSGIFSFQQMGRSWRSMQ